MNPPLGRAWRFAVTALAVIVIASGGSQASAQEDPYGSTTTTAPPQTVETRCQLRTTRAQPGDTAEVRVTQAPRGQFVRVLFDGEEVARKQATGRANQKHVNVDISYVVPQRPPGSYRVAAVGDTFTAECGRGNVGEVEVLGAQQTRSTGSNDEPRGGFGRSFLPRTGLGIALTLVIAVMLVGAGRALVKEARRRRPPATNV